MSYYLDDLKNSILNKINKNLKIIYLPKHKIIIDKRFLFISEIFDTKSLNSFMYVYTTNKSIYFSINNYSVINNNSNKSFPYILIENADEIELFLYKLINYLKVYKINDVEKLYLFYIFENFFYNNSYNNKNYDIYRNLFLKILNTNHNALFKLTKELNFCYYKKFYNLNLKISEIQTFVNLLSILKEKNINIDFISIIQNFKLNRNLFKIFIEKSLEILNIYEDKYYIKIIKKLKELKEEDKPVNQKQKLLIKFLDSILFSKYSEDLKKIELDLKKLKLKSLKIEFSPFFENNKVKISFELKNLVDIKKAIDEMKKIEKIFEKFDDIIF